MRELGLSESFQVNRFNSDQFFSFEAQTLVRILTQFDSVADFTEKLFAPMNSEFAKPTLIQLSDLNMITVKC